MKIKIYRRNKSVPLPVHKSSMAAGLDVYVEEDTEVRLGQVTFVETGLIIQPPEGYHIKLFIRSGFSVKNNVSLVNSTGIIDEDYCGENDYLNVALIRHISGIGEIDSKPLLLKKGDRIGQIIFEKTAFTKIEWDEQDQADFAGESRGGFGSTGTN